jgi:hypothetical protein
MEENEEDEILTPVDHTVYSWGRAVVEWSQYAEIYLEKTVLVTSIIYENFANPSAYRIF